MLVSGSRGTTRTAGAVCIVVFRERCHAPARGTTRKIVFAMTSIYEAKPRTGTIIAGSEKNCA
jgi:hypothetical protein